MLNINQLMEMNLFLFGYTPNNVISQVSELAVPKHNLETKIALKQKTEPTIESIEEKLPRKRKNFNYSSTTLVWKSVYGDILSNAKCKICAERVFNLEDRDKWEIAHIVAFSKGGSDDFSNLRPVCRECNRAMGSKNLVDYCKKMYPERYERIIEDLNIK